MKQKAIDIIRKNLKSAVLGAICIAVAIAILFIPGRGKKVLTKDLSEYSSVSAICELATLRSYYHNVAMYEEDPSGINKIFNDVLVWPFGVYTKVGYKQYWLEYSGIVETGIDASRIRISEPDSKGVVEAYIPDAKVLNVYAEESSLTDPITSTGLFTTISGEKKAEAFAEAQSIMRKEAENDQTMLARAKQNAKLLLEKYIINTGKEMGMVFTVKWVDN